MIRSELKQNAKKQNKGNILKLDILVLLAMLIGYLTTRYYTQVMGYEEYLRKLMTGKTVPYFNPMDSISQYLTTGKGILHTISIVILAIIGSTILPYVTAKIHLKVSRGGEVETKDFVSEGLSAKTCLTTILTQLLVGLFVYLWTLLLIIPGIIKSYAYSLTYYIIADNPDISALEAIKESNRLMKGHKWDLFVLQLSFFWWYLLEIVTFGLASFYTTPYRYTTLASFYDDIKSQDLGK